LSLAAVVWPPTVTAARCAKSITLTGRSALAGTTKAGGWTQSGSSRLDELLSFVQLYKALGGGQILGERPGGCFKDAGASRGFAETRICRKRPEKDPGRESSARGSRSNGWV